MKSLKIMLERIVALVGTKDLNDWETGAVKNYWRQSKEGTDTSRLTGPQSETIEKIFNKHFED